MSSISQCKNNIIKYRNLKSNLNSIVSNLALAISNTDDISSQIKNKYSVNDSVTPTVTRTIQLKNDMKTTYNYLKNKVIPAIDVAISNTNKELRKLEQENR